MVWVEKSVTWDHARHHEASLVMPISDPRDRFFIPHHTPMQDTYFIGPVSRIKTLKIQMF